MTEYLVQWLIDIDAETPEAAALQALNIQRDKASIATAFDIYEKPRRPMDGPPDHHIDLGDDAPDMLELLTAALPYVEDLEDDEAYKPGVIKTLVAKMRRTIEANQ